MSDLLDFSPPGQATFSLAGAKARFFNAGTTTPRTVYADEAETIPHPSPLLADSSGRFAQAFVSGGAVKVVVTQADDSTGYTLDPCVKVSATGSAASSISFTPSVLRPQTNVQDAIDSGTFPPRTITGSGSISVADGDGASGNPTISFNRGAPVIKTADFTVAASENWLINNKSGSACVVTLPAASGATGREIMIQNLQAQAVNSASSNVVPLRGGSAGSAILPATIGAYAVLVSNGTNWLIVQQSNDINLGVAVASTSGVNIDFTGIPSWARRVTILFSGVSTSGTSNPMVQIGDAGGIETTGYAASSATAVSGGTSQGDTYTTGYGISSNAAAAILHGSMVLELIGSNTWVATHTIGFSANAASSCGGGSKTLSDTLTQLRITTVGGADTFDAGTINISWE